MAKLFLIPLRTNAQTKSIVRRIGNIALPGSRVVFLMRYPVDGYRWSSECELNAPSKEKKLAEHYGWEPNLQSARRKVLPALDLMRGMGLEASVQVYAGSLRKALQRYSLQDPGCVVIDRRGLAQWFTARINGLLSHAKSVKSFNSAAALNPPRGRI
jgi:hypothetical protein